MKKLLGVTYLLLLVLAVVTSAVIAVIVQTVATLPDPGGGLAYGVVLAALACGIFYSSKSAMTATFGRAGPLITY